MRERERGERERERESKEETLHVILQITLKLDNGIQI